MMEHSNTATEPSTPATEDSSVHGTESTQKRRFVRSAFTPIRRREEDLPTPHETKRVLRRRILVYGLLSLFFFFVIYLFIRDPGGILFGLTGWESTLRWSGLIVYSSIIALVLFLVILLFRYLSLINMAYLNTTRHTIENGHDHTFLPPVSIIVPAYNEEKLIEGTVASLLAMDYPSFEIIIVDDGSTDNTRAVASKLLGSYRNGAVEVKLVEKSNGGKATALNAGIQVSRYDFLLNVDGDSQLSPNSLRKTIRHFVDPRLGAVAGNVKVLNRDNVWTTLQALEYVEGLNMARSAQSVVKLVNIIPGPLGVFRKQAVFDAGWYSSDTFAEDADITLKIIRAGWRVEYEPEAQAYTEAPASVVDLLKQRYRWTRGIIQAVRKHGDLFFNPVINFGGTIVMWSMAFESLIWPIMNIFANAYFIFVALVFDMNSYLVYWWLSLTILDLIAALYCTAVEKEEIRLVFYSLFYRIFFILIIDVCKTIATIEEYLGFGMNWGKLERKGTGTKSQPSHSEAIPA
ncbi:MAG: hypothetical protein BMS9Abin05_0410 [Rhodothermia bacterium]|nr:MAG: hypothetical protein BMS9Abin05_0410 [Rhodothermia bacterium]